MKSFQATVSLVLTAILAGCTFGECGPTDAAQWVQPGLYDALDRMDDVTRRAHPNGIPLDTEIAALYGNDARVEGLHYYSETPTSANPDAPLRAASLITRWDRDEWHLSITLPNNASEEELRAFAHAFFQNVSTRPDAWPAWEDALAAEWQKTEPAPVPGEPQRAHPYGASGRGVEIVIEGPFRANELIHELDLAPEAANTRRMPGEAHPAQGPLGPWKFDIRLPVIEYEKKVPEGRMRLMVDTLDQTFGYVEHKTESNHTASRARIERELNAIGIPTPNVPDAFHTMVC